MELKLTKQKNESGFISGRVKHLFAIMSMALLLLFQNANAQAPDWEWAKGIGGTGFDGSPSVVIDDNGNAYANAMFSSTVDFDPGAGTANLTSAGGTDVCLAKYDKNGNYMWAIRMGGVGEDGTDHIRGRCIAIDQSSNIIITGFFSGTADFDPSNAVYNLTSAGGLDIFVAKYDNAGNFIWAKRMGGVQPNDKGMSIALDANGNIYSTGRFTGTVDFDPGIGVFNLVQTGGTYFMYISKLDKDGIFQWAKAKGNSGLNNSLSIASDLGGNIYIGGQYSGSGFILKYDGLGNSIWEINGIGEITVDIAIDKNYNVYTTGGFRGTSDFNPGSGVFNLSSAGDWDAFTAKYDINGNFMWATKIGSTGQDYGCSITLDNIGNYFASGTFEGTVDADPGIVVFNISVTSGQGTYITKTDGANKLSWAKSVKNGTCCTYGCSTVSDAVGNAYFATPFISATTTFDSFTITNKGNIDFAIAKIPAPMPTIPRNCSEILKQNPAAPSGVYTIDPDGAGALPSMSCNCDMTTDGGGWTLVLNYNRLSGTDPALNIFTNALPLQNNTTPGFDESNTPYWGHAGNALMNAIPFNELRFYGVTTNHNRVMNFKTNHAGTIAYIKTGLGSMNGIKSKFTPLSGHNTNLPASANGYYTNVGDNAMCIAPFYTVSAYHWDIKHPAQGCNVSRWEVDDWPCSLAPSTFHQIWVRQGATDPCANVTCNISPGVYASNVLNTGCNNGTIKVKRGNGVYNFYPHIELYKDTNMVTFIDLSPGTAEYTFSNLIPGKYTVKVSDGLCCQSTFIRNIKCRAPSGCEKTYLLKILAAETAS